MKTGLQLKFCQPSWRVGTREVEAFVTETGGQLGPVTFFLRGKKIRPFSTAPWAEEKVVNYIMALAAISKGFDRVAEIVPAADAQSVWLVARSGHRICVALNLDFLEIETLKVEQIKRPAG